MYGKPNWVEIDLDAIAHNCREIKNWIGERTELAAVIKGNAYGHGIVMVAKTALENGATRFAAARVDEGVVLRQVGIDVPVLVLGYVPAEEMETVVKWRITPPIMHWHTAKAVSEISSAQGVVTPVHVKVDTGMGRFGLLPDEVVDFVKRLIELPGIRLEGLYTQFAVADEADKTYTYKQWDVYKKVLKDLEEAGIQIPIRHVCNSAATLNFPEMHLEMVRCGTAIYGHYPSPVTNHSIPLRPAMTLKSRVGRIRTLPPGSSIGYGCTYTTTRPTTVALVPIGFGDGLSRNLSNKGSVLIRGKRAPIVGRVCMDQCIVDVSGIPEVQQDDEVVLFGRQNGAEITAEEIASLMDSINYVVLEAVAARVPRVYIKGGKVIEVQTLSGE
ncbi:MAG: alanine racemase [Anaerolineae bacterium]